MRLFAGLLESYTTRWMTNDEDSLNALLGLLSGFKRQLFLTALCIAFPLKATLHHWAGLMIEERSLDAGLCLRAGVGQDGKELRSSRVIYCICSIVALIPLQILI